MRDWQLLLLSEGMQLAKLSWRTSSKKQRKLTGCSSRRRLLRFCETERKLITLAKCWRPSTKFVDSGSEKLYRDSSALNKMTVLGESGGLKCSDRARCTSCGVDLDVVWIGQIIECCTDTKVQTHRSS